jgi:cystathionine beta-lyase/cystathionine gamma-synthase
LKKHGKSTRAIHGRRDTSYRGGVYPIYQTTTFAVERSEDYDRYIRGEEDFYIYSRYHNPTVRNVEEKLAKLENGEDALMFSSGMAAITSAILAFVQSGDLVAASRRLYGVTYRFLRDVAPKYGIRAVFLDDDDLYRVDQVAPNAKLVYFETPINPTSAVVSIPQVVAAAQQIGAISMMDNTFASPINQNPLDFGVDVVVHSATKYIGGHSDVMAGAVITSKALMKGVRDNLKMFGGCINPLDAYLLDRSLKTLKVRVEGQNANALKLAEFFCAERKVRRVYYPGLPSSPAYAIARQQMHGFGGMLCVELDSLDAAKSLCDSLQVALNATSLGGVETLVSIPVLSSHINMSDDELRAAGVAPGMVRISVGLEDADDLIADFQAALAAIQSV